MPSNPELGRYLRKLRWRQLFAGLILEVDHDQKRKATLPPLGELRPYCGGLCSSRGDFGKEAGGPCSNLAPRDPSDLYSASLPPPDLERTLPRSIPDWAALFSLARSYPGRHCHSFSDSKCQLDADSR